MLDMLGIGVCGSLALLTICLTVYGIWIALDEVEKDRENSAKREDGKAIDFDGLTRNELMTTTDRLLKKDKRRACGKRWVYDN